MLPFVSIFISSAKCTKLSDCTIILLEKYLGEKRSGHFRDKLTLLKNLFTEKCEDPSLRIPYTLASHDVSSTRY